MRWGDGRESDNVEDMRGRSGGVPVGRLSLGGIAVVVVIGLLSGQSPMQIFNHVLNQASISSPTQPQPAAPAGNDQALRFVRTILGDTEDTWSALFAQAGKHYQNPKLILFSGSVNSACGLATSAVGPFYCPADRQVYLDLQFFQEMATRFSAAGDFAQAYVIAHEVGHHVQTLTGVPEQMARAEQNGATMVGAKGLQVRMELQADCLAGVWAYHGQQRYHWLEPGDIEEALNAAHAIGDDRLQQQAQGRVMPDSFTHGTSAQRVRWFSAGFKTGNPDRCDTFRTTPL